MRYCTFWRRLFAAMIDSIVVYPVSFLDDWAYHVAWPEAAGVSVHILYAMIGPIYSVWLHGRYGQTVGKRIACVIVIDQSELAPIGVRQAMWRDSPYIAASALYVAAILFVHFQGTDSALGQRWVPVLLGFLAYGYPIWLAAEVLTMLSNPRRRAIHDFMAGSVVIHVQSAGPQSAEMVNRLVMASKSVVLRLCLLTWIAFIWLLPNSMGIKTSSNVGAVPGADRTVETVAYDGDYGLTPAITVRTKHTTVNRSATTTSWRITVLPRGMAICVGLSLAPVAITFLLRYLVNRRADEDEFVY